MHGKTRAFSNDVDTSWPNLPPPAAKVAACPGGARSRARESGTQGYVVSKSQWRASRACAASRVWFRLRKSLASPARDTRVSVPFRRAALRQQMARQGVGHGRRQQRLLHDLAYAGSLQTARADGPA